MKKGCSCSYRFATPFYTLLPQPNADLALLIQGFVGFVLENNVSAALREGLLSCIGYAVDGLGDNKGSPPLGEGKTEGEEGEGDAVFRGDDISPTESALLVMVSLRQKIQDAGPETEGETASAIPAPTIAAEERGEPPRQIP